MFYGRFFKNISVFWPQRTASGHQGNDLMSSRLALNVNSPAVCEPCLYFKLSRDGNPSLRCNMKNIYNEENKLYCCNRLDTH